PTTGEPPPCQEAKLASVPFNGWVRTRSGGCPSVRVNETERTTRQTGTLHPAQDPLPIVRIKLRRNATGTYSIPAETLVPGPNAVLPISMRSVFGPCSPITTPVTPGVPPGSGAQSVVTTVPAVRADSRQVRRSHQSGSVEPAEASSIETSTRLMP